jgi:ribosomal protein S18 acetylase RimI-like enzyme
VAIALNVADVCIERAWPPARVRSRAVTVRVEIADSCTDELIDAFERLIPQLSSSAPPPGRSELTEIIESPASHLLIARDDAGRIVGSLTLVLFRIPTGMRAWIEDVVVDGEARGQGVGEALNRFAIDLAAQHGARTVDLTSRPSREAANRLYQRLGFVARETNVYRYQG